MPPAGLGDDGAACSYQADRSDFRPLPVFDGAPRTASAAVNIPTILLVIQRTAFHELAQREPHLGLVVMRNVAVELSTKLRKTTAVWVADRRG